MIGDLAFGEPFGALESGEYHFWIKNIFQSVKFFRFVRPVYRYPLLGVVFRILMTLAPSFGRERKQAVEFQESRANKRLAAKTDRKDFMSYVSFLLMNPTGLLTIDGRSCVITMKRV